MNLLRSIWTRIRSLWQRRELKREIDEELRFHIEQRTAENLAAGMSKEEAAREARRSFGNVQTVREECRERQRASFGEEAMRDVRFAFRQLRKNPGFATVVVLTLALGIGLNTAIFSVAYGVLWRPLQYPRPDRLVILSSAQRTEQGVKTFATWSPLTFSALRQRVTAFDQLAAYNSIDAQLTGRGEPLQLPALEVSPNFFATLGVDFARGRAFLVSGAAGPEDDRAAIVSDRLWRTSLKADPAIVGQTINVDGVPRTVVGVLPPHFGFRPVIPRLGALPEADIFLPNRWPGDDGRNAFLFLLGRMNSGVTQARVEAELTSLMNDSSIARVDALAPEGKLASDARAVAHTVRLQEYGTESVRTLLLIVLGAVSFVLVIACINVANLQLARLSARRGELSVRMALGAGRRRIVRQLVTEAVVLSLLGAALGVLLAQIAIDVTLPLVPQFVLPRVGGIVIDTRVMLFCLGLSLVATLLIGLLPALRVSVAGFGEGFSVHVGATRATGDRHGERLRTALVAGQIAMTLVLLIGAVLLLHSFVRLSSVSTGFESRGHDGVLQTVKVTLPERLYDGPVRIHAFARDVLDRIRHLPDVKSASLINSAPFGMMFIQDDFEIDGQPKPPLEVGTPKIDSSYFKTMGIRLLAGREFTALDTAGAPKVAIVSERVVRECFPGGPGAALGRRVHLGIGGSNEWLTVVGVVADIHQRGLAGDLQPMIYAPFQQDGSGFVRFVSFVVRTATPASVSEGIRAEIRRAAPDLPIESTMTLDEAVAASVAQPRFRMVLLGLFAMAATLIATCGIYGLMAYAVTQRRREIGVRMALGAQRGDVLRLVLTRALGIVVAGLVVGLAGAAAVTRVLRVFLFEVKPIDPIAFIIVTLLLMVVGLMAAWLPAHRAAKTDPMEALRSE
jgi:predicted permease